MVCLLTTAGTNVFPGLLRLGASNGILAVLDRQDLVAILAPAGFPQTVHRTLKSVVFPAEQVVAVGTVASTANNIKYGVR